MNWWARAWRGKTLEEQLDRELRFHLDQHTADLIARGVPSGEAHRQAQLALGLRERVKEQCRDARGTRWLDDLLRDVRHAFRMFRRLPGFAAIAVFVLALGIGATTVMFTVVNSVLLRPLAYPEPERLVTLLGSTSATGELWGTSYPDFVDIERQSRSLTMAAWRYAGGTITAPGDPEYVDGRQISADLFTVLGLQLVQGRAFNRDDDRLGAAPVAIISHGLWQRRFGGASVTGQRLVYDGTSYTVVGVAPPDFGLDGDVEVMTPLGQSAEPRMRNRSARFLRVTARLAPGVAVGAAQGELALIANRLAERFPASNAARGLVARPLQREIVGDIGSTLWLLLAAVSLVLLIACVNVASLMLARAISRERELATRVALGASRVRVVRQCLTESAVLGLAGGVLGILLAIASVQPFVAFWPRALPRAGEIHLDWRVMLAAFGVSLVSGLAFGLAPALRVPMDGVEGVLRGARPTLARSSRRLHSTFVVAELALAFVLLVSAGMLIRTLVTLQSLDAGLNVHNVLTARFAVSPGALGSPEQIQAAWQDVLDRARRVPGVQFATLTDIVPMRVGENALPYSVTPAAPPLSEAPFALASSVTADYLKVMGIPLLAGRFIDERDRLGGESVVVIDENLALHAFGRRDVVDRQLWSAALGPAPIRIVGVVGHVRHWGLARDDGSRLRDQMYYPLAQVPALLLRTFAQFMSIAVRTNLPANEVVGPLRLELRGASNDQAIYQIRTMEQLVSASLARQRFLAQLFAIFGGVALLLACVGLYGVLAYLTGQRAREFGVRMALGATAGDVMRLVLSQSAALIAVGVVVGAGGAWAAARLLVRSVEGMRAAEPITLAGMTSVLVATAVLASAIPARRAGRADATTALRQE
jgi:predicted permease